MAKLEVTCLTNGMFAQNCFIAADADTSRAVLIDPGEEAQLFLDRLTASGYELEAIWLTHAHLDHIMGVGEVVARTGVPVHLHPADRPLYDGVAQQGAWLGVRADTPPPPDHEIVVGSNMKVGDVEFETRFVPGHSPGSVAFVGQGVVFTGDALFAGSIGRTDLPGGDYGMLIASIRRELLTLPDETVVWSGHGPATTIGAERRSNPFLTGALA